MPVLSKHKLRIQHLLGDAGLLASPHTRLGYDRYGRRQVLMRYVDNNVPAAAGVEESKQAHAPLQNV